MFAGVIGAGRKTCVGLSILSVVDRLLVLLDGETFASSWTAAARAE